MFYGIRGAKFSKILSNLLPDMEAFPSWPEVPDLCPNTVTSVEPLFSCVLSKKRAQVSAPKTKKNAPAGESGDQRPQRREDKLIRLDDLIPKQDVKGGYQLLFGATDTTQTTNPTKEN